MIRGCLLALCLAFPTASTSAEEAKTPRTDLYGDPLPPGAVARLGTMRLRHAYAKVIFSKDGKQLISCDTEGEIRTWDVATGKLVQRRKLVEKPRRDESFGVRVLSPDGKIVAVRGEGIYLYDLNTGEEKGRIASTSNTHPYLRMKFSPDGHYLALQMSRVNRESILQIWDANAVKKYQNVSMPPGVELSSVAFSWDGKRLVGIAETKDDSDQVARYRVNLFLWETATGKLLMMKKDLRRVEAEAVAFSRDSKTLVLGGRGEAAMRLLSADTLEETSRLTAPAALGSLAFLNQPVFSPDGQKLAAVCGTYRAGPEGFQFWIPRNVLLWKLPKAKEPRCLPAREGISIVFAPDGKTLACRYESAIRLYDSTSGRPLHDWPGHDLTGLALAVSADGKIIASGDSGGILRLWDTTTSKQLWESESRDLSITDCFFSADGKRVTAGNTGGPFFDFQAWEATSGKRLGRIFVHGEDGCLYAAGISADGKRFMGVYTKEVNCPPGELIFWDVASGKRLRQRPYQLQLDKDSNGTTGGAPAVFSADGERLTVWLGDRLGIEEVSTGSLLAKLPKGIKWPSAFSPHGRLLLVMIQTAKEDGSDGEEVEIRSFIETISGQEIGRLKLKAPNKNAFSPDGRSLIVSNHKNLTVWDTETGEKLSQMAWPGSIARTQDLGGYPYVPSLIALPGGRVAASMAEGEILVWNLPSLRSPRHKSKRELERKELEKMWSNLTGDARKAYQAMHALTASPVSTVAFFQEYLRPMPDGKRIEKLLAELDSDSFQTREKASHELRRIPYRAEPMLRQALGNNPSLELRRRIETILAKPRLPSAEDLRMLRAIAVLEHIGTPEARRILEKLAGGAASPETHAAKAGLHRLQ